MALKKVIINSNTQVEYDTATTRVYLGDEISGLTVTLGDVVYDPNGAVRGYYAKTVDGSWNYNYSKILQKQVQWSEDMSFNNYNGTTGGAEAYDVSGVLYYSFGVGPATGVTYNVRLAVQQIDGWTYSNVIQYTHTGEGYYDCGYGCNWYTYDPGCTPCTP